MTEERKETRIKMEKEDNINCVIRESSTNLKISNVYRILEPNSSIEINLNDKLKADEVRVISTTGQSALKIKSPSQINEPTSMFASKTVQFITPNLFRQVGNRVVRPVGRVVTQSSSSSNPSPKLMNCPKDNETFQSQVFSNGSNNVKQLETENISLRHILLQVRMESVGKSMKAVN